MKKRKSIRKALLVSTVSILSCAIMLTGTTYAWFTDSASTAVNTIHSGTLDIELEMWNGEKWVDATTQTLKFLKSDDAAEGEATLWEPGCTYELPQLRIRNNGDLALKYQLNITGILGDAKLNEAIEWNIEVQSQASAQSTDDSIDFGEERSLAPDGYDILTISGHMMENAGNEYQNLYIRGISIAAYATQDTVEYDSTGNQYDADAQYGTTVSTYAQLVAAVNKGGKITLTEDIMLESTLVIPAGRNVILDMNGKCMYLPDGANPDTCDPMIKSMNGSSLVIDGNGKFDVGANPEFSFLFPFGDVTINSGTFTIDQGLSVYGSFFMGINGGKGKLIINGGYFDGGFYEAGNCFDNCRNLLNGSWGQYIRVYGGTFVAQNPAWGDEGMCFTCPQCDHTPGQGYCQSIFFEGQAREDTTIPDAYTVTEGTTEDGRPTYTVTYHAN